MRKQCIIFCSAVEVDGSNRAANLFPVSIRVIEIHSNCSSWEIRRDKNNLRISIKKRLEYNGICFMETNSTNSREFTQILNRTARIMSKCNEIHWHFAIKAGLWNLSCLFIISIYNRMNINNYVLLCKTCNNYVIM